MKTIIAAGAALLLLACGCRHEDTGGGGMWRTVEPRLSTTSRWYACERKSVPGRVVDDARCHARTLEPGRCDDIVSSAEQADRMLLTRPQCTNEAIAALSNFARDSAAASSDLAAAYYVRAQLHDDPADFLNAFDAARRAVAVTPPPPGAQFNYALILEALSLNDEALEAWQRAAAAEGEEWATDARERRAKLAARTALCGEERWKQTRERLDAALDMGNVVEARRLVAMFPASAEKHFEEDVLQKWALSPTPQQVLRVATCAQALSQFFRDRYFNDVAAAVVKSPAPEALRQGHLRFAEARATGVPLLYERAARLLREGGSPQSLLARIAYVENQAFETEAYGAALEQLQEISAEAARYPSVLARIDVNRLFPAQFGARYMTLFDAYDAARKSYAAIHDWEDLAEADAHVIPAMTVVGLKNAAWRRAFVAMRQVPLNPDLRQRYLLTGATADAALGLGHAEAAWLCQNSIVPAVRAAPAKGFIVSVLDHLAAFEIRLRRYDDAQRHLGEAAQVNVGPKLRKALQTRLAAVQAELALHADPRRAVSMFDDAIALASKSEYPTFVALLHARRAEAFQRMGQEEQAAGERRAALVQLHDEEERVLKERKPGQAENLWSSYFSRFDETYDLLIRQLFDSGRIGEAFQVAERARAYEPLDLVRRLPAAPAAFRKLAAHAESVDVGELRAQLPPNTFLIEYRVVEDRTYAWILSRDVFGAQSLKARREDVKRWTDTMRAAAINKDAPAFEQVLRPAYDALLRQPLEFVRARGGAGANIVIIPDRVLNGLSFVALRDPDTSHYLIQDHVVSSSGSALLYVFAVLRDAALARDTSALLVGDPAFDPNSTLAQGLKPLSEARRQVEQVSEWYPHAEVLTGDAATPDAFLRRAGANAIVDVAAHAVVNGDAPSQSYLLFNGILDAQRLMNDLHPGKTRLVVLGACSSAGGLPVGDEGIAPLVRPLVGAGVPGIVGALWDIGDATAAHLLVSFHRRYRQGSDAAKALREAQLEQLRSPNPGERLALSWAPFQVTGYASSPFASVEDIKKEKPP